MYILFREHDIICLTGVTGSERDRDRVIGSRTVSIYICGGGNSVPWQKTQEYGGEKGGGR